MCHSRKADGSGVLDGPISFPGLERIVDRALESWDPYTRHNEKDQLWGWK